MTLSLEMCSLLWRCPSEKVLNAQIHLLVLRNAFASVLQAVTSELQRKSRESRTVYVQARGNALHEPVLVRVRQEGEPEAKQRLKRRALAASSHNPPRRSEKRRAAGL